MDLRTAILEEHSKAQTIKIVQWIADDPQKIQNLIDILLHDEYRVVQRAAWVVSGVAEQFPEQVQPHIPALVNALGNNNAPVAVKRNVYRILQYLELPEAIHADLMNDCFASLLNPREALAVRAFAMSILSRMVIVYPEISNELRLVIEDALLQEAAPSFKSRAKKVLKQLG